MRHEHAVQDQGRHHHDRDEEDRAPEEHGDACPDGRDREKQPVEHLHGPHEPDEAHELEEPEQAEQHRVHEEATLGEEVNEPEEMLEALNRTNTLLAPSCIQLDCLCVSAPALCVFVYIDCLDM